MVHNQVPVNWRKFPLSQIAEVRFSNVDKKTMPGETAVLLCNYLDVYNNNYISRDLDFMEATATYAEIERFKVQSGDVIITKDSETPDDIGIPAVVIQEIRNLVCGYHLALIKPNRNQVDSAFLAKQMGQDRIQRYFSRLANGMTRFGLTASVIEDTPIWLAPISEQHKISKILSTIDELIQKTHALIAKYLAIKQGMMQDLFSRGMDENGKLRPPFEMVPELYKEAAFGFIPRKWEVVVFGEYVDLIHGHQFREYDFSIEGYKIVKIGQISANEPLSLNVEFSLKPCYSRLELNKIPAGQHGTNICSRLGKLNSRGILGDSGQFLQNPRMPQFWSPSRDPKKTTGASS